MHITFTLEFPEAEANELLSFKAELYMLFPFTYVYLIHLKTVAQHFTEESAQMPHKDA